MNSVNIVGRIGQINKGSNFAFIKVAINKSYKDKDGNKKTDTTWVSVACWKHNATYINKYANVGNVISVQGELSTVKNKETGFDELQVRANIINIIVSSSD
ncbi:MAG: single-stranded DNA-binding protein [Mariprofundales bacterium]